MTEFSRRRRRLAAALSLGPLLANIRVHAQGVLPAAITFVVPQAPGGSNDVFARAVATRLPKFTDGNVVVDNRQGAGGNVGSAWVARSAPHDGSVWLVTVNSTQTVNPIVYSRPGFDPIADFEPVCGIATVPHVLLANKQVPVATLADVLALARREPGRYSFGSAGNGSFSHLLMEYMMHSQKVDLVHVPYKGVAPAITDLIGGQVQYVISTVPAAMPFIRAGQVKPIAVPSLARLSVLPNVPVANETVPGMVAELWIAIYAPKGTPREAIYVLHDAVGRVQALPEMEAFVAAQGAIPLRAGPSELLAMTRAEMEKWAPVVREAGMKVG